MITQDFYGKKGFIWWVGIVEDVNDPLQLGSVRVRIIGAHSEDKMLVPTEALPWAQIVLPVTGSNTTNGPREGEWVFGFFQDGDYAQIPVVVGVFPGIESVQSTTVYRTAARRDGAANKPRPSQIDRVIGEPTTPRISRGILEGTLINVTNQDRKHVCDISPDVKKATNYIRGQFGVVIKALRDGIRLLLKALGFEPSGELTKLVQLAKALAREIKYITDIIAEVNLMVGELIEIARQIRAMIDYILGLPEKLKKFLSECLANFLRSLATGVADLFVKPGLGVSTGDFTALSKAFNEVTAASKQLLEQSAQLAALPSQIAETLLNPASVQDVASAEKQFLGFLESNKTPAQEPYTVNTSPI